MKPTDTTMTKIANRRPIKTRATWWAKSLANQLIHLGLTPNTVSVMSIFAALFGALCFLSMNLSSTSTFVLLCIAAAICIQLRLLLNMLDGLMAVEGDQKSPTGILFNEIPDRIADILLLIAAGYACGSGILGITLGWAAAIASVSTAYIRCLGGSLGQEQDFSGPIAKPQRMFLLTLACFGMIFEFFYESQPKFSLISILIVITLGSFITCWKRTQTIARKLQNND
ncbi:MAG: CDP-alcohol phosphatidyltransferase family protein [Verrucomicrobiota bacterium]